MTNNIKRRVHQHKQRSIAGFTAKYKIGRLLYVETFGDVLSAIGREKQIKKWRREKKIALINSLNSDWQDLSKDWYE